MTIAVMLSAQCTDERVNKTTPSLFARADTPEKMSKLSLEEIFISETEVVGYDIRKFILG